MIAILTGDVVGSQELPSDKRAGLQAKLEEAARSTDLSSHFELFSGDSWQCMCPSPQTAVQQAISLRAYLYGKNAIDTRISIGIGDYESLRLEKISLSQGEAFVLSGRGLQTMPTDRRLSIQLSDSLAAPARELTEAAVSLLDGITSGWTAKQAQAVSLANTLAPQNELAQKFDPPISAQAFGKHLASAQWKLVKNALASIESGLATLLSQAEG